MLATVPNTIDENVFANGHCEQIYTQFSTKLAKSVRWTWRHADAVCFDVDSTVCQNEAIDDLADFCGVGQEVAELTKVAMNGNMTFREALTIRLNLIRPSKHQLQSFLRQHPPRLTPGIVELVDQLHRKNVKVFLVTGGFRAIVLPVAKILDIPEAQVFANVLAFDEDGVYTGFDHNQLTSDSGGKTEVCRHLKEKFGFKNLVMVGDGATDMETYSPEDRTAADGFIGFGGNIVRDSVLRGSEWFADSFEELTRALNHS